MIYRDGLHAPLDPIIAPVVLLLYYNAAHAWGCVFNTKADTAVQAPGRSTQNKLLRCEGQAVLTPECCV
jgi:hypothetical protein